MTQPPQQPPGASAQQLPIGSELRALAGLVRASGDQVAEASRAVRSAPVERIGTLTVDAAAARLVDDVDHVLGRLGQATGEMEQMFLRLAGHSEPQPDLRPDHGQGSP